MRSGNLIWFSNFARCFFRPATSCLAHITSAWNIISSLATLRSSLASRLAISSGGNARNSWLWITSMKCSCKKILIFKNKFLRFSHRRIPDGVKTMYGHYQDKQKIKSGNTNHGCIMKHQTNCSCHCYSMLLAFCKAPDTSIKQSSALKQNKILHDTAQWLQSEHYYQSKYSLHWPVIKPSKDIPKYDNAAFDKITSASHSLGW